MKIDRSALAGLGSTPVRDSATNDASQVSRPSRRPANAVSPLPAKRPVEVDSTLISMSSVPRKTTKRSM
jgi:hypothetical protein